MLTTSPTAGGDLDLTSLRGWAIADAHTRFRRLTGEDAVLVPALGRVAGPATDGALPGAIAALGIAFDDGRLPGADDPAVEQAARWLLEKLDAAGLIYERAGEGWRLRCAKLHAENEQRLDELGGWGKAPLAGQRRLLEHVDDPGDSGTDLEQSLSKLAAAGWAKKDKGPPTVYYAAGDMPLARGADWRAPGSADPRLAAALAALLAAVSPDQRETALSESSGELSRRLPALAIGAGDDTALLDLRTVAKALRDVGGLDLPCGEPLGPVLAQGKLSLRAAQSSNGTAPDAAGDPNDPDALIAAHGGDAVRFALLHAAAPAKRFHAGADVVAYAAAFLAGLREFASSRLDGAAAGARIDLDDALRRRLAGWCDTAVERSAENHERLDTHRATRNAIALLARIEDFDARLAAERPGAASASDREAVAVALAVLARLLVPLAPSTADELWGALGLEGSPAGARWPGPQREPAAA